MQVSIHDRDALLSVSPMALSAYASMAGWSRQGQYRTHSDIYTGDGLPEIVVPRTSRLGDYASVVAVLVETFASVADQDELTVYRSLVTADRDVIRVRASEGDDGSVTLNDGASLIGGARDLVLSVACSLRDPRPLYRAGANKEANDLLDEVRLGQTEQGSFVVTMLTPVVPPPVPTLLPDPDDVDAPAHRLLTKRIVEALSAAQEATLNAVTRDESAFAETVERGVSANLCEALVRLIEPFPALDINVSWAHTRPAPAAKTVGFAKTDAPILREAARLFRLRAPRCDMRLHGFVRRLDRGVADDDGMIGLVTSIDKQPRTVTAMLDQSDYEKAIQAHGDKAFVVLEGDLDRRGQTWRLLNARLADVVTNEAPEPV